MRETATVSTAPTAPDTSAPASAEPRWNVGEAAAYLGLPVYTTRALTRAGIIPLGIWARIGHQIRYDPARLREWMADGGSEAGK